MTAPVSSAPKYCQINLVARPVMRGAGCSHDEVQSLLLWDCLALRRDSTEQEFVRHVGTPSFGNSHWVKAT